MSGGGTQTQIQELSPTQAPFVEYGLGEAQRLYQSATPSFFPAQTFVGPSQQTQSGLAAMQNRALEGNPLVPAAQQQYLSTIEGDMLGATNPYFQQRFQTAADAATQKYFDAMNQINSQASMAGRYGSGAMGQLQDRATGQFTKSLSDTAGALAFDNFARERQNQLMAAQQAPMLAQQDYADIGQLLQTGQIAEGYQQQALQDAINRFDFQQNIPQQRLQNFLSAAYGAPLGGRTTAQVPRGGIQGLLGGALAGGALASSIPALGPYAMPIALGTGLLGAL
jgi:hypothetical protein